MSLTLMAVHSHGAPLGQGGGAKAPAPARATALTERAEAPCIIAASKVSWAFARTRAWYDANRPYCYEVRR